MDDKKLSPEIPDLPYVSPVRPPEILHVIESPEKIAQDILKAEKEIASESLRMLRARYEKERIAWDKILADKEQRIVELSRQLDGAQERIKAIEDQCAEERAQQVENLRASMKEAEIKRVEETKRWEMIAEEVKIFRETATSAQAKLWEEKEKAGLLKAAITEAGKKRKEELFEKDEEIRQLNERLTAKEANALTMQGQKDEEIHLLGDQLSQVKLTLEQERQYQAKVTGKKDSDLNDLQKALQDTIVQLNLERRKLEENADQIAQQQKRIQELEDSLRIAGEEKEKEIARLARSFQEERTNWDAFKTEFTGKETALRTEAEDQLQRALRSIHILEQQLADEKQGRKETGEKLDRKDLEIKGLLSQKDGLIQEWKRILEAEREAWQKQQDEIIAEFDRIKSARENDFKVLGQELNELHAALAEENRLFVVEKEANRQLTLKLQQIEEDARTSAERANARDKEWQAALMGDQELFKKQMEENRLKYETQIQSRDLEIYRLDEDVSLMSGQLTELRQKLSLEKNENNNRLDRIQELETEMKSFTARFNEERGEWQKKLEFMRGQWEQQHKLMREYQEEIEKKYRTDVQSYQERIKALQQGGA